MRILLLLLAFAALSLAQAVAVLSSAATPQAASDDSLAAVRRSDRAERDDKGKLALLPAAEHMRRANVYMTNRAFAEARGHWEALIAYYPQDTNVSAALLGIGRTYYLERRYDEAMKIFDRVARNYSDIKDGREGLNFSAASSLRAGNPAEAVVRYREYIEKYPAGERIDSAYLNVIDTLREAGQPQEAIQWVARTREKFPNSPTDTNALFARLRLDVAEGNWKHAVATADELAAKRFQKGVLTTVPEVLYLKAYSLEQAGRRDEAFNAYLTIPDTINSFYGWLATQRVLQLADAQRQSLARERARQVESQIVTAAASFPAPYRLTILQTAKAKKLDPRFVLAIIRQESVFGPQRKSSSGARGLLQLTIDAAQRYAPDAGLKGLRESQLYQPETSILIGSQYLADLMRLFPDSLEAVAASYNGGEDNIARWLKRAKQNDAGVFTAEIGFDQTKDYVQKVMANYRAYRQLYTVDLVRK